MKYEFICRKCGEMLRNRSKAALVLSAQNHYAGVHGIEGDGEDSGRVGWDETKILREIHQIQV